MKFLIVLVLLVSYQAYSQKANDSICILFDKATDSIIRENSTHPHEILILNTLYRNELTEYKKSLSKGTSPFIPTNEPFRYYRFYVTKKLNENIPINTLKYYPREDLKNLTPYNKSIFIVGDSIFFEVSFIQNIIE